MATNNSYPWKCVLSLLSLLVFLPIYIIAATPLLPGPGMQSSNETWKSVDYQQTTVRYHYFTNEDMNETYQQIFGAIFSFGTWELEEGEDRIGLRGNVGLMLAVAEPLALDETWTVNSSELQTLLSPLSASVLYRFAGKNEQGFLSPYVGIGIGGFFGFERIAVDIERVPGGSFDWHDTRFRKSFAGHALLGLTIGAGNPVRGILEVQWTQGGKGNLKYPSFSDDEIAAGWEEVVEDFRRPEFNFTGVSISLGLQW